MRMYRGRALRRRYAHAAGSLTRARSLLRKAAHQEVHAGRVDVRRQAAEKRLSLAQQRATGARLKIERQIAGLRAQAADLWNEASSNRALAATLERKAA